MFFLRLNNAKSEPQNYHYRRAWLQLHQSEEILRSGSRIVPLTPPCVSWHCKLWDKCDEQPYPLPQRGGAGSANLCLAKGPDQILHIHLKAGVKIQLIAFIWWHHLDFNEYRSRRLLYNLSIYLWSNSTLLCQRVLLGSWWTNFLLFEQL